MGGGESEVSRYLEYSYALLHVPSTYHIYTML